MTDNQLTQSQSILLDLIRYFLAAVVVLGHGFGFFLGYFNGFFPRVFPHPQSIAVVCFFYLSGFLIVGSQIRQTEKGESSLGKYLFDRTTRVYLTLVPSLIFVVVLDWAFKNFFSVKIDSVIKYTQIKIFIENLLLIPSMPYGTMRPIWSLMYEWWIYVLFGGIYFFNSNRVPSLLLISAGTYYTFNVNSNGEAGHIWIIWLLGGVCAYSGQKISWKDTNNCVLDALSCLLLIGAGWLYFQSKSAYNLPAGILVALFLFVFTRQTSGVLQFIFQFCDVAPKLAQLSFTLFLTHYTILTYSKEILGLDGWTGLVMSFLLSNLVALLIALFTEYKLKNFKNFFKGIKFNELGACDGR